jgi:hypothetical protein
MNKNNVVMFWLPRVLNIAYTLAAVYYGIRIYIFLRGFDSSSAELTSGVLIALIPILILLLTLIFSWRRSWLGAAVFIILTLVYIIFASIYIKTKLIIAGLLFLVGLLYTIEWLLNKYKIGDSPTLKSAD